MRTFSRREVCTQKKPCAETSSHLFHGLKEMIEVSENALETLWNI